MVFYPHSNPYTCLSLHFYLEPRSVFAGTPTFVREGVHRGSSLWEGSLKLGKNIWRPLWGEGKLLLWPQLVDADGYRWNHGSIIAIRVEDAEHKLLWQTLKPGWACICTRNTDEFVHQWGCFDVPSVSYHVESGNAPLVYSPMEKLDRFFCDTHQVIQSAICNE